MGREGGWGERGVGARGEWGVGARGERGVGARGELLRFVSYLDQRLLSRSVFVIVKQGLMTEKLVTEDFPLAGQV